MITEQIQTVETEQQPPALPTATHFVIDIETANNISAYLVNRPLKETIGLWEAFKKGQSVTLNEQAIPPQEPSAPQS